MKLTDTSIARPVTITMVAVGLLVFGMVGVTRMPVDIYPQMTVPMVIIGTLYPGAGPQEIESSITLPLEKQLGSTPSLNKMSSRSIENISVITLQFEWGANLDAASADIRDRLAIATSALPDGAQTPFVLKLNTSMMPIGQYTLTTSRPCSSGCRASPRSRFRAARCARSTLTSTAAGWLPPA
jgi:HAE1 family hydrophobic/amphiphilic exporter-1